MSESLVLLTSNPMSVGRATPNYGGSLWMTGSHGNSPTDGRARLGFAPPINIGESAHSVHYYDRNLLPGQYWQLYKSSPDVRACVDSIVRRIATWDWMLTVKTDPREKAEYERLQGRANEASVWLQKPNKNGDTWQEVMALTVLDVLLYDAGMCEMNMNGAELTELVSWLGSDWLPVYDEKKALLYYQQSLEGMADNSGAKLPPERALYLSLFRNNRGPLGLPLLDTLVNECVTVLLASEHAMLALDANEIPPGLLVLGGVAGAAAAKARADLETMKGKDHRIRIVSSPQPGGVKAEWIEFRHTLKDLEMADVVESMRRVIWRVFGVMPVELGVADGIPRANATVQVDVSSSHLITPILDLLQAKLNAQVLPLLLGEDAAHIKFEFDRKQPLTPAQRLQLAQAQDLQVRRGIITVNEARADDRRLPLPGGDVAIVDTNEGPVPLEDVAAGRRPSSDNEPTDDEPTDDEPTDRGGGGGDPVDPEPTPLSAVSAALMVGLRRRLASRAASDWLPSDWPSPERWRGYRTLDTRALGAAVADYGHAVAGLYSEVVADLQVALAQGYGDDNRLSPIEAASTVQRMTDRLDDFVVSWSELTRPLYLRAATLGYDGASEIAGGPAADMDVEGRAEAYRQKAMEYLAAPEGLAGTMLDICRRTVAALTQPDRRTVAHEHDADCPAGHPVLVALRDRVDALTPDSSPEDSLRVMETSLTAQAHRIDNWSGRLVGLSNEVLVDALNATASSQDGTPVEWWCEWVNAGGRSCPICMSEGGQGFRPLGQLTRRPGEDTYCVGNCRCVLVFWTKAEIDGGGAVKLSALAPGGPDA